jgi:HEAT repeat protein
MSAMKTIAQSHEEAVLCLADVYALQRLRFLADKSRHAPLLIMQAETRIRSLEDKAVAPLVRLLTTEGIRPELRARTLEPPDEPTPGSAALDDAFLLCEQRVSAALLLGKLLEKSKLYAVPEAGMPELVRGLERALSDPSPKVRATAAGVLGRTGAKGRSALPALRQAARDADEGVAQAAAAAITAIEEAGSA